ncbi:hypothetical protein [Lederbergia citrea]|uniref:Uncharacterized protein n=1 Tax=Lederbergia citrea TaxID=2833581 RepID=A0A942Z4N4_9BACI|nr:hypothetical protein [Lederbergia citrea]MBS4223844.1 hypothetical protein [Lederbergia citrea]
MQKRSLYLSDQECISVRESWNEISIIGSFEAEWDAEYYFTNGFKVFIPVHLLDSVSKAVFKLIEEYHGDEYQYCVNNETLEFEVMEYHGGVITEDYRSNDEDRKGITASFQELLLKRTKIMKLLQLPDNDEWKLSMGISGCY